MVTLRDATSGDIVAVLAFWRDATTVASTTDDERSIERLLVHDPQSLVVASDGANIVGTVIVGFDGWRGAMYRLAVATSHRRRGIATALVAEGERRLHTRGGRRLHMVVQAEEAAAQGFWKSAGYQPTDQVRFVKTLDDREKGHA